MRLKVNIRNYPFAHRIKARQRSFKQKSNGKYKIAYVKLNTLVAGTIYNKQCELPTQVVGVKGKDYERKEQIGLATLMMKPFKQNQAWYMGVFIIKSFLLYKF